MINLNDNFMLSNLVEIARGAGELIMTHFRHNASVECKSDGSPVTIADKEAEDYIVKELKRLWADIPVVGEETSSAQSLKPSELSRFWLVDPLDGTREFINNSDEFTVNIALIEDGLPTCGVIYAPAKDLFYIGQLEYGSYRKTHDGDWQKLPLHADSDRMTVVISRSHPTKGREEAFLATLGDVGILKVGSSLKFCMVAENSASLYFRAGRTMFWDSAAGHIIAKAAGAGVFHWGTDTELTYSSDKLENPEFMVVRPKWANLCR
ncbi:MAG: 3'(2'),5'-bisphosphate nucleotidase CysQ [Deferribacteraceae bacterium]|jgi:3'(2'), 5'-bisphosphate nucleotidase|nr:3'(2'),5'-bisphosphate nucleotidase CysQ [Deferribacteraceae bacterium]